MYELLKELKEKGFPQEGKREPYCSVCGKRIGGNCLLSKHNIEFLKYPTLEEAIQTCGDVEFRIHCYPKSFGGDITGEPWYVIERMGWSDMLRYSTPLEAVLRLWIALQVNK